MKKNVIYIGSIFFCFMLYFKSRIGGFMKDKVNKGLLIAVIAMVLVICLLVFKLSEDTVSTNKEKNKTSDNNTQVVEKVEGAKDFDLKEAEELLDKFGFNENFGCGTNIYDRYYSESFKQIVAIKKVSDSVKTNKKCSEIYTEKREFDNAYKGQNGVCYEDKGATLIPYDEANKIYKEMYGEDIPKKGFSSSNLGLYFIMYDYNESLNSFVSLECGGCGGACANQININKIKSAYTVDDNLVIDVYHYNGGIDSNVKHVYVFTSKGYLNLEASKIVIDNIYGSEVDKAIEAATKEIEEKYLDKLDVYEVIFTKKDGNYIFKSLTKKLS